MNDNLGNQENANEDIILNLKDEKFYLRLQKFGLMVKGDDLNSTYKELMEKKKKRISIMKELNLDIPVNRPKRDSARHLARIDSERALGFFLKTIIFAVVFLLVVGIVGPKLNGMMGAHLSQLGSMAKRNMHDLINLPFEIVRYRVIPFFERHAKVDVLEKALYKKVEERPMELERQEKIIKSLRVMVQRLKPFVDELRPLFKGEESRVP